MRENANRIEFEHNLVYLGLFGRLRFSILVHTIRMTQLLQTFIAHCDIANIRHVRWLRCLLNTIVHYVTCVCLHASRSICKQTRNLAHRR